MKNDYNFWEDYLKKVKKKISKLCNSSRELHIDFHIHSNYSTDGKSSIKDIIEMSRKIGLDIISITDHDTIDSYSEIFEYVKNGLTNPIIIPGIEFTVDNPEYGNQCHMIQLFINPKDKELINKVRKNQNAVFNRSIIQFERLKKNRAIQEILSLKKKRVYYKNYLKFINKSNLTPGYESLGEYLMLKLKKSNVNIFDILELLEKYNLDDCYADRRQYKSDRYQKIRKKYNSEEYNYDSRLLISMLAVREVDDDWWCEPQCGSLSVNSYGQLKIEELDSNYPVVFAHPTQSKVDVVVRIINNTGLIVGIEKNIRNVNSDLSIFLKKLYGKGLFVTIGSDNHDNSLELYKNIDYFSVNKDELKKMISEGIWKK